MSVRQVSEFASATILCIGYYLLSSLLRWLWLRRCLQLSTLSILIPDLESKTKSGIVIICILTICGPEPAFVAPLVLFRRIIYLFDIMN